MAKEILVAYGVDIDAVALRFDGINDLPYARYADGYFPFLSDCVYNRSIENCMFVLRPGTPKKVHQSVQYPPAFGEHGHNHLGF